jgi:hypothetical protein
MLPRGYAGFTEATTPRQIVVHASTWVPLFVRLVDSAHRPAAFVLGADATSRVLEGGSAPEYLEVLLAPPAAYTLLGLPMDKLSGQIVDSIDVLGAPGQRLTEQLRATPSWQQRFALMDQFLLHRLTVGPQPSPEVGWACA